MTRRVPNCEIAQSAGISPRHLYRLRKKHAANANGELLDIARDRVANVILLKLGQWDLIGTPAERYLDDFIIELVTLIQAQVEEDTLRIDCRWAKANARQIMEVIRNASERQRERLQSGIDPKI
jgi:AcrR family transcriptional regulator